MTGESVILAWLYAATAAMQIYYDFSGYSDMAIGLGRMFGFHFPENFRYPFIAASATVFWRRWHITLGSWFRDYVYIPLGGNRAGKARWLLNIMIVWLLTGLWHGAGWNYIIWGAGFGILLILEKSIHITVPDTPVAQTIWKIVKHVKSNAIVVAKNGMTYGVGAGQMNRIGSAEIALKQAQNTLKEEGKDIMTEGLVLASDGFFPFNDCVALAAEYGIKAIVQPGGSIRDEDSIKLADEKGITMLFTGERHFKH